MHQCQQEEEDQFHVEEEVDHVGEDQPLEVEEVDLEVN
jgi:hypothetical protein